MLQQFMTSGYSLPDYQHINDRLLYTDYINKTYTYQEVAVDTLEAYRYQGNLYGLFKSIGIDASMLVYAMYLNGYTNPTNYDGNRTIFKMPIRINIPEY